MKKTLFALTFTALLISGCAGRPANPTSVVQATDKNLSCNELAVAAEEQQRRATTSYAADEEQKGKNVALGVAGALLFWPALFAMETGDHNLVEAQAHERRADHLRAKMAEKNC